MSVDQNQFEFNIDNNILSKITGNIVNPSSKSNKIIWNYSSIIVEEEKIKSERKEKEGKTIKPLNNMTNDSDIKVNNPNSNEKENANEISSKDKYESELYSKTMSFSDFSLTKYLIKACSDLEYFYPTKVQEKTIPMILKGKFYK